MTKHAWLLAIAVAGVLSGCPKRLDFGPEGEIENPEALLRLIAEAEAKVVAVVGETRVRVDTPEVKGAFSMFAAVSRPALIHLEPLDFFGRPQAVLVVQGEQFGLYQAEDNRYYTGPASPQNVSRFLPIALSAQELTLVLLGATPRIQHQRADLRSDEGCACYVLTLHQGEVSQELQVHPNKYRVQRSRIRGTRAYDLEFGELTLDERAFPRRAILTAPTANVRVDLRFTDVQLNEAPDLTMFELSPIEGAEVVEVSPEGIPQGGAPPPTGPRLGPAPAPEEEEEGEVQEAPSP